MQLSDINGYDLSSISAYKSQLTSSQFALNQVASTNEKPAPAFVKSGFGVDTKAGVPQTSTAPQTTARSTNGNDELRGTLYDEWV